MIFPIEPTRRHYPAVLVREIALLWRRQRVHVPGMAAVDRIAQWILRNERLLARPVVVVRVSEQDPNTEVDRHEIVRNQFAVDDDAWSHEHLATPVTHILVLKVAVVRILESTPASQQDPPLAVVFVAGKRLI